MTTHAARSGLRRFFGVATDVQTYRNLVYLALTFPLGVAYFAFIWGGGSVGVATLPIAVGVPILFAVLAVAMIAADAESRLARTLLGADVRADHPSPRETTVTEYAERLVLEPRSYLAVVYLLSKFAVGIAAFAGLVTAATLSIVLTAAPFLYRLEDVSYRFGSHVVDTVPEAALLSVAGVLLAFVTLHAVNLAATALARYAEVMLGTSDRPA